MSAELVINSVLVSWSAPSSAPAGYEVFLAGGSTSVEGTPATLSCTDWTDIEHSFFVVG